MFGLLNYFPKNYRRQERKSTSNSRQPKGLIFLPISRPEGGGSMELQIHWLQPWSPRSLACHASVGILKHDLFLSAHWVGPTYVLPFSCPLIKFIASIVREKSTRNIIHLCPFFPFYMVFFLGQPAASIMTSINFSNWPVLLDSNKVALVALIESTIFWGS